MSSRTILGSNSLFFPFIADSWARFNENAANDRALIIAEVEKLIEDQIKFKQGSLKPFIVPLERAV